ncbi:ankyrin repeat-containing domain protein [Hypoxylon sp. FL1857]|nr:ankyrin repeat-containing domain protein [Hypoxylon sp. FL1857]
MSSRFIEDLPSCSTTPRALPDEVFYYMARDIIDEKSDIASLSRTCRPLFQLLEHLLYRADVLETRETEIDGQSGEACLCGVQYGGDDFDTQLGLQNSRVPVPHIPALHWAVTQSDKSLGLAVAGKCITAALIHWPNYLHVSCQKLKNMTPLQLAAKDGLEEIVKELVEASSFVDARVCFNSLNHPGEFPLIQQYCLYRLIRQPARFYIPLNALGIAIMFGHTRIAETLAQHTRELEETSGRGAKDLMPPLKLAAFTNMPSVVRILQDRGYQSKDGNAHFTGASALHLAAIVDGSDETLELLLNNGADINTVDTHGGDAFQRALERYRTAGDCISNLVVLARHYSLEEGPQHFFKHARTFLRHGDLLPVVKVLLQDRSATYDPSDYSRLHSVAFEYLDHRRNDLNPEMLDYLVHHPSLKFSEGSHSMEFEELQLEIEKSLNRSS